MKQAHSLSNYLTAFAALILAGCASWTKPITTSETQTGNHSYLYGKFKFDTTKSLLTLEGHETMGFVFSCSDGEKYRIRFEVDQPLQVIKLNPSTCSFNEIIYTDSDGTILGSKPAPPGLIDKFTMTAGSAYYIGDYVAASDITTEYNSTKITWNIKEASENYHSTTAAMQEIYPNMKSVSTHNHVGH